MCEVKLNEKIKVDTIISMTLLERVLETAEQVLKTGRIFVFEICEHTYFLCERVMLMQ